jgi:outer membrane protein OmpA-like peptidoglycan-associated protein
MKGVAMPIIANASLARYAGTALAAILLTGSAAAAQTSGAGSAVTPAPAPATATAPAPAPAPASAPAAAAAPPGLFVYFASGSAAIRNTTELDHAARLYNAGKPIVMVVTGATDSVGSPDKNLQLAEQRANAVLAALVARGIPADRFQVLAKGETDPAVRVPDGTAEAKNRVVEITWR